MVAGCVWGIDIGKSALKAVRVREGKEEVEILAVCHLEYEPDEDGVISPSEQSAALEELLRRYPMVRKERVVVSLPGQQSFSRFIKLPDFEGGRVDSVVAFEAQQQIPFPIDEVVWDFDLLEQSEEAEEAGDDRECGLFAIKKDLVYAFLGDLKLSGLEPDVLTIAPLATYNFVRFDVDFDPDKAIVVLDIGLDHTDLVIIDGERYWLRNLALSGQELTKAIATKLKKPHNEAEDLKREAAQSEDEQARKVYQATQLVLKDFVSEIHRSIGFYKAQNKGRKIDIGEILLLGNGSKLPSIRPFFQRELGYPVKTVKRISQLTLDDDLGNEDIELLKEQLPTLAVAFGLGVQGAGFGQNAINLLPKEMQLQKALQRKKLPVAIAVGLCFLAVLFGYMRASGQLSETEKVVRRANENLRTLRQHKARVEELKDVTGLQKEISSLIAFVEGRNQPLDVLNGLVAALPAQNGVVVDETMEQIKELSKQQRLAVQRVESELRQAMERLNLGKLWLLELDLEAASYVAGRVKPGTRVSWADGRPIAVDDARGWFRTRANDPSNKDIPVGRAAKLVFVTDGEQRQERDVITQAGVRATLTVAKVLQGDEKATLDAIERELLLAIRERLPEATFDGSLTKVYGLELGATVPPTASGFGQEVPRYQTFVAQKIAVDHPATADLLGPAR